MQYTDQSGRTVSISKPPARIVSLVPSITELICDLGHTEQLVGCTRFCVHPQSVVSKVTKVGGTKNPKLEKIKELQPDLILANKEENEREHIESLAERISVWVTDVKTVDDNLDMIRSLASIFAKEQKGEELCSTIDSGFHQLSTESNPIPAAYLIWRKPYMVAGGDTFISDVMRRAGFQNCFVEEMRYPEKTIKELKDSGAEVIMLSSEPYRFRQKHCEEISRDIEGVLPVLVDGEMFSWYGSRMAKAPSYLKELRQIVEFRLSEG